MQTKLIILFAIFAINSLKAQNYLPLFELDSTEWNIHYTGVNGVFDSNYSANFKTTKIDIDTIVYSNYAEIPLPLLDMDSIPISVSTDNGRAWIFLEDFNKKILVYDMTLEMGDTFKLYTYNENTIDSVGIVVDSIFTQEGRKIIEFKDFGNFLFQQEFGSLWKFRFIEGVGPINFFFYGFQSLIIQDYPYNLVCKSNSNNIQYVSLWESYNYKDCQIYIGLNHIQMQRVEIYPNPTDRLISIQLNKELKNAFVYDLFGKKTPIGFKNSTLNVSNLSNGVYFLIVEDLNGEIYHSKFIKK